MSDDITVGPSFPSQPDPIQIPDPTTTTTEPEEVEQQQEETVEPTTTTEAPTTTVEDISSADAGALPRTGSSTAAPLAQLAVVLVAAGGLALIATRRVRAGEVGSSR